MSKRWAMNKAKSKRAPSSAEARIERGEIPFIICKHRKNHPKISPLICEKRCQRIKGCREYFNYLQPSMFGPDAFHRREHMRRSRNQNKSLAEPTECTARQSRKPKWVKGPKIEKGSERPDRGSGPTIYKNKCRARSPNAPMKCFPNKI